MKKFFVVIFCCAAVFFLGINFRCSAVVGFDMDMDTILVTSDFADKNKFSKKDTLSMVSEAASLANEIYEDEVGNEIYNPIINLAVREWISKVDISRFEKSIPKLQKNLSEFILQYNREKTEVFLQAFRNCVKEKFVAEKMPELRDRVLSLKPFYEQCDVFVPILSPDEVASKATRYIYKFFMEDSQKKLLMEVFLKGSDKFEMVEFNFNDEIMFEIGFLIAVPVEWYTWDEVDFDRLGFDERKSIAENFKIILQKSIALLDDSKALIRLPKGNTLVVGDLHGNVHAACLYIDLAKDVLERGDAQSVVFLGDYVDRGFFGIEVIMEILNFKIRFPDKVFLLRGNHETEDIGLGTFALELAERFSFKDSKDIEKLVYDELFTRLPLAAEFSFDNGEKAICVHGGIPPVTEENEAMFRQYRFIYASDLKDFEEKRGSTIVSECLLWSDPCRLGQVQLSRGKGFIFDCEDLDKFLSDLKYKFLVRGHEVAFYGLREDFPNKCYTVFSSHEYNGDNLGAMVLVSHLGVKRYWCIKDTFCDFFAREASEMLGLLDKEK